MTGFLGGEKGREIALTQGRIALVDESDFETVSLLCWHAYRSRQGVWYAHRKRPLPPKAGSTRGRQTTDSMHRYIMQAPCGLQVDHIDGDGLNNRRHNLRLVTSAQNQANRHRAWGGSLYKGVTLRRDGGAVNYWRAVIRAEGKIILLGHFPTQEEAALAYDEAAIRYYGTFACLNFPRPGFQTVFVGGHTP
jgi:hypothetical protein